MLKIIEKKLIYYPINNTLEPLCAEINKSVEEVVIESSDKVNLHCWYVKADNSKPTIIFCHGQGENRGVWQNVLKHFSNLGLGVLMLDLRAHGLNNGEPSEMGMYHDLHSAVKYLEHKQNLTRENIILWGRSLGGAIVAEIASRTSELFHSIILESTFTNMREEAIHVCKSDVMQNKFNMFGFIVKKFAKFYPYTQKFETDKKVHLINSPLFIGHSKYDEIAPVEMSYKLSEFNKNAQLFISEIGDHDSNDWIFDEVEKFISQKVPS